MVTLGNLARTICRFCLLLLAAPGTRGDCLYRKETVDPKVAG
ncbi:hypothetical protein SAMN05216212_3133 [Microbulbifer yueqingensis]|uniref:Uncharacterized protein n=1 Tax=Microbulbifer yueqingensis TaxID=658219 RepID=A0A1G9EHW4_9GAMM|nr:hypothetical protein SAMN05216212_3133 [Microbulbifer yueqingensis]